MTTPLLLWFRLDLRLDDHPALHAALKLGCPIIPLYIASFEDESPWLPGGATRWWLHHSLHALDSQLRTLGSRLIIRQGSTAQVLDQVITQTHAHAVYWSRRYEPHIIKRDEQIKRDLKAQQLEVQSFNSSLLHEPWEIATQEQRPYQVFTPFWRACLAHLEPDKPLPAPTHLPAPAHWPDSLELDQLNLLPRIKWDTVMSQTWKPGALTAQAQLKTFAQACVADYHQARDVPAQSATSRLSPHLHVGEISPRQIWHTIRSASASSTHPASKLICDLPNQSPKHVAKALGQGPEHYLREIGWREFAYHLLYHFPHTPQQPLREPYARFPWRDDAAALKAWQRGQTGYPLVDAGMRELYATGWMHNRVRMVVASFLVKHLLLPWHEGARWFWDTLVDADLASNTLGWQWAAGCGADAAPYFRIFNPILQGEKFDPQGQYVRQWVPELAHMPEQFIHKPWEASPLILHAADVELGRTYPPPIVEHTHARERALAALSTISTPTV